MRALGPAAVVAALLLGSCTSSHEPGTARGTASGSGSPPASAVRTSSAIAVPADLRRRPADTAIGDPMTADLCAAIGLAAIRDVNTALTPAFDARQDPPGCAITVSDATKAVLALSVFARRSRPVPVREHATRVESGLTVDVFPYDAKAGSCERDLVARGARLVVDAFPPGRAVPDKRLACGGTDAITRRLAAVVAAHAVPRLALPVGSVSDFDACEVVRRAGIGSLAAFAASKVIPRGFEASCELKAKGLFLFVNIELVDDAPAAVPTQVEGHRLQEISAGPTFCAYASAQGRTADGRVEQVVVRSTAVGRDDPPAELCTQTAQALARYLTAAGLT